MKGSNSQKGNVASTLLRDVVITLLLIFAASVGYQMWKTQQIDKAKVTLNTWVNTEHIETVEEVDLADAAEKAPQIKIAHGVWRDQQIEDDGTKTGEMIMLAPDGRFTMDVFFDLPENKFHFEASMSGQYQIKGSVLIVKVQDGAKGLIPKTGRIVVKSATSDKLVLADANGADKIFWSRAAWLKSKKAAEVKKAELLSMNFLDVPLEQKATWIEQKNLNGYIALVMMILVMPMLITRLERFR